MKPTASFERRNVSDVGLELTEKNSELHFDLNRDVTEEDRKALLDQLVVSRGVGDWASYLPIAATIRKLDDGYDPDLTDADKASIHTEIARLRKKKEPELLMQLTLALRDVDPDFDLQLTNVDRERMRRKLTHMANGKNWFDFVTYAARFHQIDPSYKPLVADWPAIHQRIEAYRDHNPWALAFTAAAMHELDPAFDPQLSDHDWDTMKRELDVRRNEHELSVFSRMIVALDTIQKATLRSSTAPPAELPPLPETKSYYE